MVDIEKYCETVGLELGSWKEDRQGQEVTGSKKWAKKQSLVDNWVLVLGLLDMNLNESANVFLKVMHAT